MHPQAESYWGNVNPIGPRSCYDEAKRFAEALTMAYHRVHGTDVRIARIFNTYGPRMRPDDGRVVTNFVVQALSGEPLTVYGDGHADPQLLLRDRRGGGAARAGRPPGPADGTGERGQPGRVDDGRAARPSSWS